jgi:selenocysteine lyase/cysteine desulfurase
MDAAVGYLEDLGRQLAPDGIETRRAAVVRAMEAIREYEASLSIEFLKTFEVAGATVYGVSDPAQVKHRTPTFCFNVTGVAAAEVAARLAEQGIGVRDGHMYAPRLMRRLKISEHTGAVRASLVHYNTLEEIGLFGPALRRIAA